MRFVLSLALISLTFSLAACQQRNVEDSYSGFSTSHQKLVNAVEQSDIRVLQQGDRVCVIIPSIDFFTPQKSELIEDKGKALMKVAALVASYKNSPVRVIGFSDNIGSSVNQYYRSQNQAEIVAAFLWRGGVSLAQTTTQVLGSSSIGMVSSNATNSGRNSNERVEVWIN